jgi:chemotaxis protein MotB
MGVTLSEIRACNYTESPMRSIPLILLVIPLLLTGCSSSESVIRGQQAEIRELRLENDRLRQGGLDVDLRQQIARLERELVEARSASRGTTVDVLSTDLFFESGSADLSDEGVRRLSELAGKLRREHGGKTVRVEGYTDNVPIGPTLRRTFPSNWELSAARAAAVVRHLQERHQLPPERFEVVGYGAYHPVASNGTVEGRAQNRRVRVAVIN